MFSAKSIAAVETAARERGIEPAALMAVAEVESGGRAFALVDGRREPLIRFEGHCFDRRLSAEKRVMARERGLSSPKAGAVANPATQAARWRLLERAEVIDRKAALESTSWGLGQVMGAHWAWLGYADVDALVSEVRDGVSGQARVMARFIEKAGLADALRGHDWRGFARRYNGPGYARNAYHLKLAKAYRRHKEGPRKARKTDTEPLTRGMRGPAVGDLQCRLCACGYPLSVDCVFGRETAGTVRRFQRDHGLEADAIVGPATRAALERCRPLSALLDSLRRRARDWVAFLPGL